MAASQPQSQSPKRRRRWLVSAVVLLVAYLATGLFSVKTNERAVVRRFGRALVPPRGPGLHIGLPYGVDRVDRVKMLESKRVAVLGSLAARAVGRQAEPKQSECLTGDRNLIQVSAVVQYRIHNAADYLFKCTDVSSVVSNVAASALSSAIAAMNVDDVLTVRRIAVQNRVQATTQDALDGYGLGVVVTSVSLESVAPPKDVAAAFQDVTKARGDRYRAVNEAETYANRLKPKADAEAYRLRRESEAARDESVKKAEGDAAAFGQIATELAHNRRLGAVRLILEALEEVLPRVKKIVLDGDAGQALDLGLVEDRE